MMRTLIIGQLMRRLLQATIVMLLVIYGSSLFFFALYAAKEDEQKINIISDNVLHQVIGSERNMQQQSQEHQQGRSRRRLWSSENFDLELGEPPVAKNQGFQERSNKVHVKEEEKFVGTGSMVGSSEKMMVATKKAASISTEDLFLSVKTTKSYHSSRLELILDTWFRLAKKQTWFFTDSEEPKYQRITAGHLINTNCSSSHNRKALCCKMSVELDSFLSSDKKWFCHFDDDNYVNVPRLVKVLSEYDPEADWYLGKPSIRTPLEILNRERKHLEKLKQQPQPENISFWFATGGAGFCLSKALALKMAPIASNGKFMDIGDRIRLPDDVTMGYIIEYLLGKPLTVIEKFHSHLEPMRFIPKETFHEQITFSYSQYNKDEMNVLKIDGLFDVKKDPTRFYSLHCYLFPNFSFCPRRK